MYLYSRRAGRGRGIWTSVSHGTIDIREENCHKSFKISYGAVEETITRQDNECTILRYGQDMTVKTGSKITYEEFYEPDTLQAVRRGSIWKRQSGVVLCGKKGTLECYSTSSGAFGREVFTYNNGTVGYIASRRRKQFEVYRPNGKLWIVIKGKVAISRSPLINEIEKIITDSQWWYFVRQPKWDLAIYGTDGQIITHGHFENHQKDGKWIENGRDSYYMSGIPVSRCLHEDDPDSWNPYEILKIPNAQLRGSLLN